MIEGAALNWVLTTGGATVLAGTIALVKKVYNDSTRLSIVETKYDAVVDRLDSIDDSLKGITTLLLNRRDVTR